MKNDDNVFPNGFTRDELDRLARKAEANAKAKKSKGRRPPDENKASGNPDAAAGGSAAPGTGTTRDGKGSYSPPDPSAHDGPVKFTAYGGPLPETAGELLDVINNPNNLAHALAALRKLGEVYGRDVVEDNASPDLADFNPMIVSTGVGSNKQAITSFALYAAPLRRALARYFQATTPDIGMMIDMAVVAYWKAVQAERMSVTYLSAALENPHHIDRIPKLEMVKELAVRQMTRLLDGLRVATGRRVSLDPDEDIPRVLRFPKAASPLQRRARRASGE